jgi:hypothetical protein
MSNSRSACPYLSWENKQQIQEHHNYHPEQHPQISSSKSSRILRPQCGLTEFT